VRIRERSSVERRRMAWTEKRDMLGDMVAVMEGDVRLLERKKARRN